MAGEPTRRNKRIWRSSPPGERAFFLAQAILLFRQVQLLPQPRQRPHPEHSHCPRASPHAAGDLVVREPLDVAQEDDLGIISREPGHCIGQAQLELVAAGALAGGRVGRREQNRPVGATTRPGPAPVRPRGRDRAAGRRQSAASRAATRGPRSGGATPPARPRCRRETSASRARPRAWSAARYPTSRISPGIVVQPEDGPAGPASFDSARVRAGTTGSKRASAAGSVVFM